MHRYSGSPNIQIHTGFNNKKVIVTGARGFIGSHLCERLKKLNAEVHGITRFSNNIPSRDVHLWSGHLEDFSFVKKIFSTVKPEFIFHLSGFVNGTREVDYVPIAYNSLLTSTVNILTVATQVECNKIILTGSQEEPELNEEFPGSPYAAAKWASRNYARMFQKLYGTSILNPRIFMVYGPAQKDYRKLIPYVTLSLLNNKAPKLTNGSRPVDWIYVDDVVDSLLYGAISEMEPDRPFHIGSGIQITVREIVYKIISIMGSSIKPVFGFHNPRPHERIVSADLDNVLLKPKVGIDEGLKRTVNWYMENYHKIIDSSHYKNQMYA